MTMDDTFGLQKKSSRRSLQALEAMLDVGSPMVRDQEISKALKRRSTTLSVQKSLQLLDESVASPPNRSVRTPGGSARKSSLKTRLPLLVISGFAVGALAGNARQKYFKERILRMEEYVAAHPEDFVETPPKKYKDVLLPWHPVR